MKEDLIFLALALLTEALVPLQAGTNASVSKSLRNRLKLG
jgi:hypothetical protein